MPGRSTVGFQVKQDSNTDGVGTHATIEYNIITGFVDKTGIFQGAGIVNCDGLIQNNIIEDNVAYSSAGLLNCNGTIQNNIIRHNRSVIYYYPPIGPVPGGYYDGDAAAIGGCNGIIRNNTIVDNYNEHGEIVNDSLQRSWKAGGLGGCHGTIVNNIIYHTTMTMPAELNNMTSPTYCLFRTPRSGVGNVAGDPRFADPAGGDYHLLPGSPAIDAGTAAAGLLTDFDGVRRGVAPTAGRGDGSGFDLGAFEAPASPVAVWLPGGAMPWLADGTLLPVSWALAPPADTAVRLRLYAGGRYLTDLGRYPSLNAAAFPIQLPKPIYTRADYTIVALSIANAQGASYLAETPLFTIIGTRKNAIPAHLWQGME